MARVSTLDHWESYWKGHQQDIDDTYSTGGRLVREVLADGPVAGRLVMEIGAGSGRDLLELARQGARGIVLDYSPASLRLVQQQARARALPVMLVQADATRMPFRDGAIDISFHQCFAPHVSIDRVGNSIPGEINQIVGQHNTVVVHFEHKPD